MIISQKKEVEDIYLSMNIKELIKGIIIGIAKIIPGLSGAVLMISFNLYDRAIEAITNFFGNPKRNFLFLANLGCGVILGVVLFSKIIHFFITSYYFYTTSLFIGLILGGMPVVFKNIEKKGKSYIVVVVSFLVMSILSFSNIDNHYVIQNNSLDFLMFFLSGILEAIGTVLPGISSTALLMLVGVYNSYIGIISNVLNPAFLSETLYFLVPFSLGLVVGIIVISLLVHYLFRYYREQTFAFILGISLSSVFLLIVKVVPFVGGVFSLMFGLLLMGIGYFITSKL